VHGAAMVLPGPSNAPPVCWMAGDAKHPDRVRVRLTVGSDARAQARKLLDRLQRGAASLLCMPSEIADTGDGLALDYAVDSGSLPFAAALTRWRASLAVYLSEVLTMARYLERCITALAELDTPLVVAPACLRYQPTGPQPHGAFRLLAVPLIPALLADWVCAPPDTWTWLSGDSLLRRPPPRPGPYAIGAAVYTAVAGELFPVRSAAERFRRALRGQAGTPGAVAAAARAALPGSFTAEADALDALVTRLLSGGHGHDWRDQLARVGEQLDPYRTAVRWEHEGEIQIARQILERLAATVPDRAVPWRALARLRERDGDETGAHAAALAAVEDGDPDGVRGLVADMRRIAGSDPDDPDADARRIWLASAADALGKLGSRLGDAARIQLAHLEARYLGRDDSAAARLADGTGSAWDDVVRRVVLARLTAAHAAWPQVAKLCKEARLAVQEMPLTGGALGGYVIAYLDYLDGVAHFGAVGVYADAGYLADAFDRFVAALDRARTICDPSDPLIDAVIGWLGWIGSLAHQLQLPAARAIGHGIDAYLAAHGIERRSAGADVPVLIWYDEDRLLTLSGVS